MVNKPHWSLTGSWLIFFLLCLPVAIQAAEQAGKTIQWFSGSVEQAFSQASNQGKPVFLYWGAKWCPPCNELKATLFKSPAFIEKTRFFIPVYLDGDTQRAQQYGETYSVMGYPTLILFDKGGNELTRIPGGMDLQRYPEVLDLVLRNVQPVNQLISRIMEHNHRPSMPELKLLAHYAWQQDAGQALADRDPVSVLRTLSDLTPTNLGEIKGRFDAEYLYLISRPEYPVADLDRTDTMERLVGILKDPRNTRSNLYFVIYDSRAVIEALTEQDSRERKQLADTWEASLGRLAGDTTLSSADRLRLYKGQLELITLKGGDIPAELKRQIADDVEEALNHAGGIYQRITISYTGYGVLQDSGQTREAQKLLENELSEESNSSYWMLILAGMSKKAEHNTEAIDWYRRAWEKSRGAATRLQWGAYYVDNLTKLEPGNHEAIESASRKILQELHAQQDPLYGRNKRAIDRIGRSLVAWADTVDRRLVYRRLKVTFDKVCVAQFTNELERDTCRALFDKAEAP